MTAVLRTDEVLARTKAANRRPHQTAALREVPPYCYMDHGRTAEEATAEAMKALGMRHAADALALVWRLRWVATANGGDDGSN